jgi:hypothetical protein
MWGIISGAVVGAGGLFVAGIGDWRNRVSDHQLAEVERKQRRLEEAYVDLLSIAELTGQWAQLVAPMLETNPPQPVPDLPSMADQARVAAVLGAFGSKEVQDLRAQWIAVVREQIHAVEGLAWSKKFPGSPSLDVGEYYVKVHENRPREVAAREAMVARVAKELGHRAD